MSNCTRYLGLDVHAETVTAAIAEERRQIRSLGKFPNRPGETLEYQLDHRRQSLSSTAHSSLHLNRHGGHNEKEKTGRPIIELAGSFHINALLDGLRKNLAMMSPFLCLREELL
jgi:hypothetical protein